MTMAGEIQFADRERALDRLAEKGRITVSDLAGLDVLGRYLVVSEFWASCDRSAKLALQADESERVKRAAMLAAQGK